MVTPLTDSFVTGFRYGQFVVQRARDVPELRCRLIELKHELSGASVIHIQNDDSENLFCLSFQTIPYSSNGIAHVLEHLVLCGSDAFPVRDPFFSMTRRSMNTYMNALTGTDYTCYPASSQIEQDFYNLLTVYLDAVFHPKLDPFSFMQEGHRLEFSKKGDPHSPLQINGVVYNEMKGALVNPMRRLMKEMCSALFPNTSYGFDSGGDPKDIPSLTLEELKAFHQAYYHPSRCLFFFYGDMPLGNHLDALEKNILGSTLHQEPQLPVTRQKRLTKPVVKTLEYPIATTESLDKKAYIAFGWLTTEIENQVDCLALSLLEIILLETDASFLKYRLLQSGHCRQVSSSCDTEMPQVPFVILMTGCDEDDASPLSDLLFASLEMVVRDGLSMESIEHAIHQLELAKSEIGGDGSPFGLSLYSRVGLLTHYGLDPMRGLEIHRLFNELRDALASNPFYYPQLIRKYFLDNPHFVRLVMTPNNTLDERERSSEELRLKEMQSYLDEATRQSLIEQEERLSAFQEAKQDLSCLPTLHLRDVPKKSRHIPLSTGYMGNIEWFSHDTFTNDLVYLDVVSPIPKIAQEDLWLVRLFTSLLPQMGCGNMTYQQSLEYLQAYTGGVFCSLSLNHQIHNPLIITPSWHLKGKCLGQHVERLTDILNDFLLAPNFDDRHRMKELLEKRHVDLENSLSQHALEYATGRANGTLSEPHYIAEMWSGLTFVQKLRDLIQHYPKNESAFLEKMDGIKQAMLGNEGVHIVACADPKNMIRMKEQEFFGLADLPKSSFHPWETFDGPLIPRKNQGYVISSSVSFTTAVTKTTCYASPDAPCLSLLAQLLNDTFLHRQLREYGGAYGGGAASNPMAGTFSFYSYKDPNLYSTLEAYEASLQFIQKGNFSETELEEAKLGVLQDFDSPISPGSRAEVAYSWWRQGKTEPSRQSFRDGLMQARREDIQALIPRYFPKGWSADAFVAFAGQELFDKDLPLFERGASPIHLLPV